MTQNNKDIQKIKELIEIMKENDLVEIEIKHGEDKIALKRFQPQTAVPMVAVGGTMQPPVAAQTQTAAQTQPPPQQPQEELVDIKASIVGTFYAAATPDSEPYGEVGSHVDPQKVVCIIEAMKVMNEIKAETSGTIVEILVTNGQAVEYGQVLFRVKPD
jgi:acetyl-CoA carboxylase biotin carboxyl carrier protein